MTDKNFANAAMWLAVGATISVAIMTTENLATLWFFLLPALVGKE